MKKIALLMMSIVTAVMISGCSGTDGTNGTNGADGLNIAESALVKITVEASGTNCLNGGQLIEVGNDANANGVLDIEEISTSEYICNGTDGTDGTGGGAIALIALSDEPLGVNCEFGGQRIDAGLDDNANTVLDEVEIDNTS